jgi:hypothetical protein
MVDKSITMDVDETLELDYLIEEISRDKIKITNEPTADSSSVSYISRETGVFNPSETGVHKLDIDGQVVEVQVIDIPDSALTQDLVAWYRFENGDARDYTATLEETFANSTAYDGTVNGATYQPNGGVTDFKNRANSGAFDFSGSNTNEVNLPGSAVQTGNATRTTMCWVKVFSDTGDRQMIVGSGNGNDSEAWEMEVYRVYNGSGERQGALGIHTWSGYNITNENLISLNDWLHFAATHDGNPSNIQIYLNGQPVETENNNDSSSSLDTSSSFHRMGYSEAHGVGKHHFDGIIDDFRIYNRNLTDSEINDIYNNTKI